MKTRGRYYRPLASAFFLVVAAMLVVGCRRDKGPETPVDFKIACAANLSRHECAVAKRFSDYLQRNLDSAVWTYKQHFGNVVNTDDARELSKDYAPDGINAKSEDARTARTKWSAAVQEPSRALSREIYRRMLAADTVVFTAGGAGAGKTTAVETASEGDPALRRTLADALIIYDTTLSSEALAAEQINQALAAKKKVEIIYVYRDPVDSLVEGALPRAMSNGRTLPLKAFIRTHLGAPLTLEGVVRAFKSNPNFSYVIVDNSLGRGKAKVFAGDAEAFFKTHTETASELMPRLEESLKEAHQGGKISDAVFSAFMGSN